jgi:hypothetical protein
MLRNTDGDKNMIEEDKTFNRLLKNLNFGLTKADMVTFARRNRTETFIAPPSERCKPPFIAYRKKVRRLTEEVKWLIPGIENRGFKAFHIDHKISIWHGYKYGLPAEDIAHIDNLRMLPYKENMLKGRKCCF